MGFNLNIASFIIVTVRAVKKEGWQEEQETQSHRNDVYEGGACRIFSENISFYKKIFLQSEIDYCNKFKSPYEHFAGKFAIKEAVIKSIDEKILPLDIEIYYKNSKPQIKLKKFHSKYSFKISMSHEKDYAIAIAIALRN